jgi:LuxR family quorum sensing-dependent transcriptional regulator
MMDRPRSHQYRLTRQEKRVLSLLLEGHHKKTAADAMGVSVNTVSFHLKNASCKLGVHSKTEAVVKGLLEGILVPDYSRPQQLTAG